MKEFEKLQDHYSWLNVKSKYKSLKKKLREFIIEKLNEVLRYFCML